MVESAAHRNSRKQRRAARPLLRAASQLLLKGGVLDNQLAQKLSAAVADLIDHHGTTIPPAVLAWYKGQSVQPVIDMTWTKQMKPMHANEHHQNPPKEHKFVFCGKYSGTRQCKHYQYYNKFTDIKCEGCRKLWSDTVLLKAQDPSFLLWT